MTKLTRPGGTNLPAAELLLAELISIPSINPEYDVTSPGENALGDAVARLCESYGCEIHSVPVMNGRRNITARLRSGSSTGVLLIEAHLDTVGLPGPLTSAPQHDMSVPRVEGTRMYGRGACDVKGALAAALLAIAELSFEPLQHVDVVLLGAIDEEHQFRGVTHYITEQMPNGPVPDAAIVLEPTEMRVVNEHHGVLRAEITVIGRAAHTSRPHEGRSAIRDAITVIDHLESWNEASGGRSLAVTTISGGTAINIVPGECTFGIDLRILPREDPHAVLSELQDELESLARSRIHSHISKQLILDGGMATSVEARIVTAAIESDPDRREPVRVTFGTDGSKLARAGVPTIVFGPGSIRQAHADDEWVDLRDVVAAAGRIVAIARSLDATHVPGRTPTRTGDDGHG